MSLLVTAPAEEPVLLSEAKAHLRVDGGDEDTLITSLIVAARVQAETLTGRALITQTWDWYADSFPDCTIVLPLPMLQSVTHIKYNDSAGDLQTLSTALYQVDATSPCGRVMPAFGQTWPVTREQFNAVNIRFVAGYGAASAVPQTIKQWMLLKIAELFEQREASQERPAVGLSFVDRLLDPYKVYA